MITTEEFFLSDEDKYWNILIASVAEILPSIFENTEKEEDNNFIKNILWTI